MESVWKTAVKYMSYRVSNAFASAIVRNKKTPESF